MTDLQSTKKEMSENHNLKIFLVKMTFLNISSCYLEYLIPTLKLKPDLPLKQLLEIIKFCWNQVADKTAASKVVTQGMEEQSFQSPDLSDCFKVLFTFQWPLWTMQLVKMQGLGENSI